MSNTTEAEIQSLLEKQAIVCLTPPLSPGFYSSVFVVPKKDGGLEAHNQFEGAEQVRHLSPLQDGEYLQLERCHLATGLDVQNRFKRCLPVCPNAQIRLDIYPLQLEGEVLPVQNPPFRSHISAQYVFTKLLRPVAALFRQEGLRALQCLRLEALEQKGSQDYDTSVKLSSEAVEDLQWWIHSLAHHNGRPIYSAEPSLVLESEASKKGWGAHCRENGILTGGPSTREESQAGWN